MRFDAARGNVSLGSRSRVLAGRSRSAQPARRPSQHIASLASFRSLVWEYWRENGRHDLPWRKTSDPYKILISEIMLQQTQVDRVIPKYREFLKAFPNVRALAKSRLADVLQAWNGLGYNRRAKYLRDAAIEIVEKYGGQVPAIYSELVELPGVGDYTARAVRVFAFNEADILIETNIRTAFIHYFHSNVLQNVRISDKEILPLARKVAEGLEQRKWHWALMDYGAHLKRSGVRNNHRGAHYTKQSRFEGSFRQLRGETLRILTKGGKGMKGKKWEDALASLARDGLVVSQNGKWRIA